LYPTAQRTTAAFAILQVNDAPLNLGAQSRRRIPVLKMSLAFVAALVAAAALASSAEAAGCHGGFRGFGGPQFGFPRQSYGYDAYEARKERERRAAALRAQARANAQARAVAAARQSAPKTVNVATATPAPAATTLAVVPATKGDLEKVTTVAKAQDDAATVVAQVCRKFSPAVGGLVDTACN
jgi:hypothetical protein